MNIMLNACVVEVFKEIIPKNILALIPITMDTYIGSLLMYSLHKFMCWDIDIKLICIA